MNSFSVDPLHIYHGLICHLWLSFRYSTRFCHILFLKLHSHSHYQANSFTLVSYVTALNLHVSTKSLYPIDSCLQNRPGEYFTLLKVRTQANSSGVNTTVTCHGQFISSSSPHVHLSFFCQSKCPRSNGMRGCLKLNRDDKGVYTEEKHSAEVTETVHLRSF